MRFGLKIGCFLMVCLLSPIGSSQSQEAFAKQRMLRFMRAYHIPGAAVVVLRHHQLQTYVFGEAIPAKHIPVSKETIFEVGSVTKTFTGLLLAQRILSGHTRLTDPIHAHLEYPHSKAIGQLTYLQLATHVSGLPFNAQHLPYNASASLMNRMKFRHSLGRTRLAFYPSSQMLYSNFGYGVLGRALANQAHMRLSDLMRRNILSPLKMNMSGLELTPAHQLHFAQGFTARGTPVPYLRSGLLGGAWAMRVSVADMGRYLQAAAGEAHVPASIRQAMIFTQIPHYALAGEYMQFGLGWIVTPFNRNNAIRRLVLRPEHYHFTPHRVIKIAHPAFNADALIGKTGATDGFRAYMAVIPSKHVGIAVMINRFVHTNGQLTRLANEILLHEL